MSTADSPDILVERTGGIVHLVINRPTHKNALTRAMYATMADTIVEADLDRAVRVILISGAEGIFTAGNDLADFLGNPTLDESHPTTRFMHALFECQTPVVAAVHGPAVGIGTTMLLHCDLVYAGESAWFQTPFVNLGLTPEYGSSILLPQRMGHARASEMLLLGRRVPAQEAHASGLVNSVTSDEDLLSTARKAAEQLAAQPARAVRESKRLMRVNQHDLLARVIQEEIDGFAAALTSPEFAEAAKAFFDKRKPDFSQFE